MSKDAAIIQKAGFGSGRHNSTVPPVCAAVGLTLASPKKSSGIRAEASLLLFKLAILLAALAALIGLLLRRLLTLLAALLATAAVLLTALLFLLAPLVLILIFVGHLEVPPAGMFPQDNNREL